MSLHRFDLPRIVAALSLALLCATFVNAAKADALDDTLAQWIRAMDKNGDAVVTREEILSRSKGFMNAQTHMVLQGFTQMDANGDGALTAREISSHINERFKRADSKGTGQLTLDDARRDMPHVARHFNSIAVADKSHVTLAQVRDFFAQQLQGSLARNAAARP